VCCPCRLAVAAAAYVELILGTAPSAVDLDLYGTAVLGVRADIEGFHRSFSLKIFCGGDKPLAVAVCAGEQTFTD